VCVCVLIASQVWISKHPVLLFVYVAQYMPTLFKWLGKRVGPKRVAAFKNGTLAMLRLAPRDLRTAIAHVCVRSRDYACSCVRRRHGERFVDRKQAEERVRVVDSLVWDCLGDL
jgi:hypothetical protein